MEKIGTTLETLRSDIKAFYDPLKHHFMVMNAVDLGKEMELQWFFCDYAPPAAITVFYAFADPVTAIPGISDIVPSAWVAESELADLMDLDISGAKKGFVLEPDFKRGPLRKKK